MEWCVLYSSPFGSRKSRSVGPKSRVDADGLVRPNMKIALLSFEYPPDTGFGGIGTYTWYQARALLKLGHEVHVLAGLTAASRELIHKFEDGVHVWRFRSDRAIMRSFQRLGRHRLWWSQNRLENAVSMYAGLKELSRRQRFDIVEMPECGAEGLLINYLMRVPTVVKFHSPAYLIMPTYDVRRADHIVCSVLEQLALIGASAFTSASRFLADEVRRKLNVRRDVHVVPNGIDVEQFDRSDMVDAREKFNLSKGRPIIFFSGRMEKRKGIHLCQEIVTRILERFDVEFVFAGQDLFQYVSGTLIPSLSRKQLRGRFTFLGKLDLNGVRSCLRQADIFLLPSLWENCPYSCLEAMAAGRPIVCSDAGGLPELIRDGENGLLGRTGDSASFVTALERLIEDGALRSRLAAAARETVERSFSDVDIARRSIECYEQCLRHVA
jgi:glycosyltransferase involved in cell wall biosynthesis